MATTMAQLSQQMSQMELHTRETRDMVQKVSQRQDEMEQRMQQVAPQTSPQVETAPQAIEFDTTQLDSPQENPTEYITKEQAAQMMKQVVTQIIAPGVLRLHSRCTIDSQLWRQKFTNSRCVWPGWRRMSHIYRFKQPRHR